MKKNILIIVALFVFLMPIIQIKAQEVQKIKTYNAIQKDIKNLKREVEFLNREIENTQKNYNEISNLIATSDKNLNKSLTIFGLLLSLIIAITGGISSLGWWKASKRIEKQTKLIEYAELRINQIKQDNEKILKENEKLMEQIELGISTKIIEIETKYLIARIKEVPEDMTNLFERFASINTINKRYYIDFKNSLLVLKGRITVYKPNDIPVLDLKGAYLKYFVILFQHFPTLLIYDDDLYNDLKSIYNGVIACCLPIDIINASKKVLPLLIEENITYKINDFFKAIQNRIDRDLYKAVFDSLDSKENQFTLYSILNNINVKSKMLYGSILLENYTDTENEHYQNILLGNIRNDLI